jgi:O-antigen ligase
VPEPHLQPSRVLSAGLTAALLAWSVGVLCAEPLASAGMAAAAALAAGCAVQRGHVDWRVILLSWWPLWAFIAWAVLASFAGGNPPTGTGVARLADWAAIPIAAWAFRRIPARGLGVLAGAVAAVFLLSCLVAGLQHFGLWPSESFFAPLRWTRLPFYRVYEPVPGDPTRFMGGGLIFHRLKFAHVGGLVIVSAAALGARAPPRWRALSILTVAFGFLSVLVFPYARAACVAIAGGLLVAVVMGARRRRLALWVGLAVVGIASAVVAADAPLRERFLNGVTASGSGDRDLLLSTGVAAVRARPVVGVGLGHFRPSLFAPPGSPQHVLEQPGKAHNEFLSMAAEVGIPGAILFIGMLLWMAARFRSDAPEGAAALGALAYFALLSQVHDPLFQAPFSIALALALGLGFKPRTGPAQASRPSTPTSSS